MFRFPDTRRDLKNCQNAISIGADIHHALDHVLPARAPIQFSALGYTPNIAHLCREFDYFYTQLYDFILTILRQLRYPLVLLLMLIVMGLFFKLFLVDHLSQLVGNGISNTPPQPVSYIVPALSLLNVPLLVMLCNWKPIIRKGMGIDDFEHFYLFGFLSLMLRSGVPLWTCCERLQFSYSNLSNKWVQISTKLSNGEPIEDVFSRSLNLDDYNSSILNAVLPLEDRFEHLSRRFFDQLNNRYQVLANALKPLLLIVIAILITYMILTYFSPLLSYDVIFNY
jgi:type II secretory pathway component PulF